MTTLEWCDLCRRRTEQEPDPRTPYGITCTVCGHLRIERPRLTLTAAVPTRPGRRRARPAAVRGTSWLDLSQPRSDT